MSFLHSFTETLIHSLWQSALLVLIFAVVNTLLPGLHPLKKRNFLFGLMTVQLLISLGGFFILYTGYESDAVFLTGSAAGNNSFFSLLNEYSNQVFFVYATVVLIKSVSVSFHWLRFQRTYSRDLVKPSSDLKVFTQLKSYHLGIKRKVSLWYSNHITTPVTFGFLKPVILLPVSLVNNISTEQAEAIILHELSHIRSKDYLLNWLLIGMEIVYFFNPFIRIIAKKIRLEREKNCDVQVINFEYDNIMYAEALLQTARHGQSYKPFQLGAAASQLIKRISFFSSPEGSDFAGEKKSKLTLLFVPFTLLLLFFATNKFSYTGNTGGSFAENITIPNLFADPNYYSPVNYSENKPAKIYTPSSCPVAETTAENKSGIVSNPSYGEPVVYEDSNDEENTNPIAIPAGFSETATADSVKEFIYDVETQEGKVTQSFKLTLVKGQWVMQPQWMLLQVKGDSCRASGDTIRLLNPILPQ